MESNFCKNDIKSYITFWIPSCQNHIFKKNVRLLLIPASVQPFSSLSHQQEGDEGSEAGEY